MSASHIIRVCLQSPLIVAALAATLGGAVVGSAAAGPQPVGVSDASGVVTISGAASAEEMLGVVFDPNRCATTLTAERRRPGLVSWGGPVNGAFTHSFRPGEFGLHGAGYVCVYVQSDSANPVTLARASTPLV